MTRIPVLSLGLQEPTFLNFLLPPWSPPRPNTGWQGLNQCPWGALCTFHLRPVLPGYLGQPHLPCSTWWPHQSGCRDPRCCCHPALHLGTVHDPQGRGEPSFRGLAAVWTPWPRQFLQASGGAGCSEAVEEVGTDSLSCWGEKNTACRRLKRENGVRLLNRGSDRMAK